MKVLVLNRDYIPLMYCNMKRAVILVYLNKAEIVRETGQVLRSISASLPIPAVIRLLGRMARQFIPKVTYTRKNIHTRDNYTCQYCGTKEAPLTLDHVLPVSRGGKSTWDNVVTACLSCNTRKANRTPEEAHMLLHKPPKKPTILMQVDFQALFQF